MKNNITELVFILDKSGSMYSLTDDTIGGFNSVIDSHRHDEGKVLVSTVLFSDASQVLHDRVPIENVPVMTRNDYRANGCTALNDAIGGAVKHISLIHKYAREEDVPEHTIFVITTDGMENASHTYSRAAVRQLITEKTEKNGWEFLFLAANIDAEETACDLGIRKSNAVDYIADSEGLGANFMAMDCAIRDVQACRSMSDEHWKAPVMRDRARREKKTDK